MDWLTQNPAVLTSVVLCLSSLLIWKKLLKRSRKIPEGSKIVRALGGREVFYVALQERCLSFKCFHAILIEGDFRPDIVLETLKLLQKRHPTLRIGIGEESFYDNLNNLQYFEYDEPEKLIRLDVINREHSDHWKDLIQKGMYKDPYIKCFGNKLLLWSVIFLHNRDNPLGDHEIIFGFCHAIDDGISKVNLSNDFLKYYHHLYDVRVRNVGQLEEIKSFPFHPSLDSMIIPANRKYLTLGQKIVPMFVRMIYNLIIKPERVDFSVPLESSATSTSERQPSFITFKLSSNQVNDYMKKCKSEGVSYTAALASILANSIGKVYNVPPNMFGQMEIATNIRSYCNENINNEEVGMFVSHLGFPCRFSGISIWDQAKLFKKYLTPENVLKEGVRQLYNMGGYAMLAWKFASDFTEDKKTQGRTNSLSLSNFGNFDYPRIRGNFQWKGFYNVQCYKGFGAPVVIYCATIGGESFFSLVYTQPLVSTDTASKIANEIKKQLTMI